jgi:hypothetical protein
MNLLNLDPVDLLDRTLRPREVVRDARGWLLDCFGETDEVEAIELLNAVGVVAAVNRHYVGGWVGFASEAGAWDGRTPRERAGAQPRVGGIPGDGWKATTISD